MKKCIAAILVIIIIASGFTFHNFHKITDKPDEKENFKLEQIPLKYQQPSQYYEKETNFAGCPIELVMICHVEEGEENICVSPGAVEEYIKEGDYEGYCVGEKRFFREFRKTSDIDIQPDNQHIQKIDVALKSKKSAQVMIRERDVIPGDVNRPLTPVFRYFIIEHEGIEHADISSAAIEFTVEDSFIEEYGRSVRSVVLSRYEEGIWEELDTEYIKTVSDIHHYRAQSPGLSVFTITLSREVEPEPVEKEPVDDEEPIPEKEINETIAQETDDTEQSPKSEFRISKEQVRMFLLIIFILLVVVLLWFIYFKVAIT